jgi:hypothetical protein
MYRPFTNQPSHTHAHRHHAQRPTSPSRQAVTYSPRILMDRPDAKIYEGNAKGFQLKLYFELLFQPNKTQCQMKIFVKKTILVKIIQRVFMTS